MPYSWISDCKGQTYKILLKVVCLTAAVITPSQVVNDLRLSKRIKFAFAQYAAQK